MKLPRMKHFARTWAMLLVGMGSVVVFAASFWPETPLVERRGFSEAVAFLTANAAAGTFVVVWPPQLAEALDHLPASLVAADAVPIESEGRRTYLHFLVVGPRGVGAPPELERASMRARRSFGEIDVVELEYAAGDRVDFDLRARLEDVRVSLVQGESTIVCDVRRPDGGWACPGRPDWNHVGPSSLKVEGRDWAAVWAHPVSGSQLIIDAGELPLWDRVELEAAFSDEAAAMPGGATVEITLEVEGVGTRRLSRVNRRGIIEVEMPTARGGKAHVRVLITTVNDGRRHLGINLRTIEVRATARAAEPIRD